MNFSEQDLTKDVVLTDKVMTGQALSRLILNEQKVKKYLFKVREDLDGALKKFA